jgi:pyruvate dehydrogenase E1 component alpha subunit
VLDEDQLSRIRTEAAARVEQAIQFAKSSPVPDPAEAKRYVFA